MDKASYSPIASATKAEPGTWDPTVFHSLLQSTEAQPVVPPSKQQEWKGKSKLLSNNNAASFIKMLFDDDPSAGERMKKRVRSKYWPDEWADSVKEMNEFLDTNPEVSAEAKKEKCRQVFLVSEVIQKNFAMPSKPSSQIKSTSNNMITASYNEAGQTPFAASTSPSTSVSSPTIASLKVKDSDSTLSDLTEDRSIQTFSDYAVRHKINLNDGEGPSPYTEEEFTKQFKGNYTLMQAYLQQYSNPIQVSMHITLIFRYLRTALMK